MVGVHHLLERLVILNWNYHPLESAMTIKKVQGLAMYVKIRVGVVAVKQKRAVITCPFECYS